MDPDPDPIAPTVPGGGSSRRSTSQLLRHLGPDFLQQQILDNKATGLLADVPGEAELTPGLWGEWEIIPAK